MAAWFYPLKAQPNSETQQIPDPDWHRTCVENGQGCTWLQPGTVCISIGIRISSNYCKLEGMITKKEETTQGNNE